MHRYIQTCISTAAVKQVTVRLFVSSMELFKSTCRTKHSILVTTETALQIERDGNGDRERERGEMERER